VELPEVEVLRRDLDKEVVGRRMESVSVRPQRNAMKIISAHHRTRKDFEKRLRGRKIVAVERRGKHVLLMLDDDSVLVVHFGMSGRLVKGTKRMELAPHTHVHIGFAKGGDLRYVDPRAIGRMFVTTKAELDGGKELAKLGIDPLEHSFTWPQFSERLAAKQMKLKALLMDQEFISGLVGCSSSLLTALRTAPTSTPVQRWSSKRGVTPTPRRSPGRCRRTVGSVASPTGCPVSATCCTGPARRSAAGSAAA
jgi:formamidopyrimidine-DNA glycosylase